MRVMLLPLLLLSACVTRPVAVVPEPVKVPALPSRLDQEPADLPPLTSNDLRALLHDSLTSGQAYGALKRNYQALRHQYHCVRDHLTDSDALEKCLLDKVK